MNKIILIGGTVGTGKSTIARQIASKMNINHVIGTGFIREILCKELNIGAFYYHTYSNIPAFTPYEFLVHQTELMKDSVNACIDRAEKEGTSLIIEGNHCIPWIINNHKVTDSFILYVVDVDKHWSFLNSSTHSKRVITKQEFRRIREIQEALVGLAKGKEIHLVKTKDKIMEVLK